MQEILPDIDRWLAAGEAVALATVIQTWGSAPRQVGAKMALTPAGKITGSVSGGCVEGAVFEAGLAVLQTGQPQLLHFGVADETAWEVGLACGGTIEVFVERLDAGIYAHLRRWLEQDTPWALATVIAGPAEQLGRRLLLAGSEPAYDSLGQPLLAAALPQVQAALERGRSGRFTLSPVPGQPPVELFVEAHRPPPTLIMVGGVHIAVALTAIAKTLGYRTVVVDPRRAFGSAERFPHVDRLIQAWPDKAFAGLAITGETAVAMLTHDPKIDDPALRQVLDSAAFYVGALGSQKTQEKRRRRLRAAGISEEQIARIHGPIGLPIGATAPEEIALAIMGEIVAARHRAEPAARHGAEPAARHGTEPAAP